MDTKTKLKNDEKKETSWDFVRFHQAQSDAGFDGVAVEMDNEWIFIVLEVKLIKCAKRHFVKNERQTNLE